MRNLLFLSFRGDYFKNIACFPLTLQPLRDNRRIFEKKICFVVREKWNVNTKYYNPLENCFKNNILVRNLPFKKLKTFLAHTVLKYFFANFE